MTLPGVLADTLVALGLLTLTAAVVAMARARDPLVQLHAASKAAFLGIMPMLGAAALTTGDARIAGRAVLIGAFLLLTTPVAAHAIARAVYLRRRRERQADAVAR